jgi:tRNA pseudouridine38-40 synthase
VSGPIKKSAGAGREAIPAPFFYGLVLEYDGTAFDGWQVQKGRRTVQGLLEGALRLLFKARVPTNAAGRTDAGVHAAGQAVTFPAPRRFEGDLRAALNAHLPEDVVVLAATEAPVGAHARNDAAAKTYRYTLLNRPVRPALDRTRLHWVARPLDVKAMKREAKRWVGRIDFAAFAGPASKGLPTICRVTALKVKRRKHDRVTIDITADRFLHHMVRRLAGRIVQAGWGERDPKPLTLPARGLSLLSVVARRKKGNS